jgi:SAM-dependent methyltransferase
MLEPFGDTRESEPPPADGVETMRTPVAKTDMVRLAYQLLLGREPENENIVVGQSNFADVYDLRNRFMTSDEYQNQQRFARIAELMYAHVEAAVRADNDRFDSFLVADPDLEARIREIIRDDTVGDDVIRNEYTGFHAQRFFDQIRAVVAIRRKVLPGLPRPRVLEIGASPVTRMYARVLDDIDLYTADLPTGAPPADIASRYGSTAHYYINLDIDALSDRYPLLAEQQFQIILFCEVIEHVLASPQEMIADLLKLLAPGGVLIVTTPNAMNARHLLDIAVGRKGDSMYRRNARELHQDHHVHVREYTLTEIRDACTACGAKVLLQAVKNYYSDPSLNIIMAKYMSAGEAQVTLVSR